MAKRYKTSRAKRSSQRRYRRTRKKYEDYLDQFEARRENFESRGLEFYDPVPLTYRDWKTVYAEKTNDLKQDIKEGKRKNVGNVNREIVSDQAYELSGRQAEVIGEYLLENEMESLEKQGLVYKYIDENGVERVNLKKKIELFMKIRQGEYISEEIGLWDKINDFRARYFGYSPEQRAEIMSRHPTAKTYADAVAMEVGQTYFKSE